MRIDPIKLTSQSQLINDYRANKKRVMQYFDYSPFDQYEQRVRDIKNREYNRENLTEALYAINSEWDAPPSTYDNIERLKYDNSVVVIGGQQAGLLTGPMYTINKIISIIQFARQKEAELKIPVIPVFWIAGEDHDYEEINHIYLSDLPQMKKYTLSQNVHERHSVSSIKIDEKHANNWIHQLFEQLSETMYTKNLYETVKNCLDESRSFVDFFARLVFHLFADEGIVLMDSNHRMIRNLESKFFVELIEKQPKISDEVYKTFQKLKQSGYSVSLDVEPSDANLFYHQNNERILLKREEANHWVGKQNEIMFTTQEILKIANDTPSLLSNNVITRPIMQELLFPTLAFVAGNGEISYWAVLKTAFHAMGINMPPVLPRLSFTYIDRTVQKKLESLSISSEHAVNFGVEDLKVNWLASEQHPPIQILVEQIKSAIDRAHQPLRRIAKEIRADLGELADKNLDYLHRDVDFLKNNLIRALEDRYEKELNDFDLINNCLYPFGALQERTWSPLEWLNNHGIEFLHQLTKQSCAFENEHYIVYL